jgi:putative spermidine/putrescine transport system permease protein
MPPRPPGSRLGFRLAHRTFCALVLGFLVLPILVIIPLSFNAQPYFTFTADMLALNPDGYSLRWYLDILENGMADPAQTKWTTAYFEDAWTHGHWLQAVRNSLFIGVCATAAATVLGTAAALGLSQSTLPGRKVIIAAILSPMIVPIVITSAALYFFFARVGLAHTYLGLITAHALLGVPFVVITVTATLSNFDRGLTRAAASLGGSPFTTFRRITLPLIFPGVASGALFAFITSFDEVVAAIFLAAPEQRTIPRQMWSGIREQISPTILAVATILILFAVALLATIEMLRARSERARTQLDALRPSR